MKPRDEYETSRLAPIIACGSCILLFCFIAITGFLQKSPTYDETVHLFAGYSYLKWLDFRVNPEHPPLAKALAALPLLFLDIQDPRRSNPHWDLIPENRDHSWALASRMLFSENDAETLFFYAKLPMIALGIVLGIFIYSWTKELFGLRAAVAALFIYSLDPNILAHSQIVHTDIPFTTFCFIGTYFFWRTLNGITYSNVLMTSLFFGLAAVTKYTFLTMLPIWGILGLLKVFSPEPLRCTIGWSRQISGRWKKATLLAGVFLCAGILAYFLIWGAYVFRFGALSDGSGDRLLPAAPMAPQTALLRVLGSFIFQHRLLPEAWTYGLLYVFQFLGRPSYLLGQISDDGFWTYFPVAFAVKTPVPTLLLLLAALGLLILRRKDRDQVIFLLIPVAVYFALAVWSRLNIGLRHLLPIYPFLYVVIGRAAVELWRGETYVKKGLLMLLALWYLWSSFHIYPHYLAFFNELAGGAKNGYKVLTDSSLDWGQDLKGLKHWMDQNRIRRIQLAYFGTADPRYYGIDALYLPGSVILSPPVERHYPEAPRYQAVSVSYIYGVPSDKPLQGFYTALRFREPIARIGHSIFVFSLD